MGKNNILKIYFVVIFTAASNVTSKAQIPKSEKKFIPIYELEGYKLIQLSVVYDTITDDPFTISYGYRISEPNSPYDSLKIGNWQTKNAKGKLIASGEYAIGHIARCHVLGPVYSAYNFKINNWIYNYNNGKPQATGTYQLKIDTVNHNCGNQAFYKSKVDSTWVFWNAKGKAILFQYAKKDNFE